MGITRSSLNRIPARLAFNGVSFYAKEGTTIDQELHYLTAAVGVAGWGVVDQRDQDAYYRLTLTPDGRMTPALAAVLWPYGNPVQGAGIFTDTDVPAVVHGNDGSLDTYAAAAVETMPPMRFHPARTLVGEAKWLALRGHSSGSVAAWSTAGSLVTEANTGGTFIDSGFTAAGIITQDYQVTWGTLTGWAGLDFYDGLVFEPRVEYVDDTVASQGLYNRRIKRVQGLLRGVPIGLTRQMIQTQLQVQGSGAGRGSSGAAKAYSLTVNGADGKVYLNLPLAQLVRSRKQHGVEQLREGEVAWECLPVLTSGVRGAYWTNPIA